MKRYIAPLAIALSLFSASVQASAIADTFQKYSFSGVCTDCNLTSHLPALGELVLKNYVAGTYISMDNFVSFHYDGTDALEAYTITNDEHSLAVGKISASLSTLTNFMADSQSYHFSSMGGAWMAGRQTEINDKGTAGTFSANVPEPDTLAMLGLGLAGIGAMVRRRKQG